MMYELVPAFILASLAIVIVSLATPPKAEAVKQFDQLMKPQPPE